MGLFRIDDPTQINRLHELAMQAAKKQVSLKDFDGFI